MTWEKRQDKTHTVYLDDMTALAPFAQHAINGLLIILPPHASPAQPTSMGAAIWMTTGYVELVWLGSATRYAIVTPILYAALYCWKRNPVSESRNAKESAAWTPAAGYVRTRRCDLQMRLHLPRLATAATILPPNDHLILSQCYEETETEERTREQRYPVKSLVPRSVVKVQMSDRSGRESRQTFPEM